MIINDMAFTVLIIGIVFGFFALISHLFLVRITGKKFDNLLKERGISLPRNFAFTIPNSWGRALAYAAAILFFKKTQQKKSARYKRFENLYPNFDFKKYISSEDVALSILTFFLLLISVILILFSTFVANYK